MECDNLELPATLLDVQCYRSMFSECNGLKTAPSELPATTLAISCYQYMFEKCTSLTTAPELPATSTADYCYNGMFLGCSSLTQAPELPATTLANECYSAMFRGCTSLNSVTAAISSSDLNSGPYTYNWLDGVASEGTFTYLDPDFDPNAITRSANTVPSGWIIAAAPQSDFYLFGNLVKSFAINGKWVKTLFLNGKQVIFNGKVGPTPRNTNFRITNIGNATDYPSDTCKVVAHLPIGCDMEVYHSDSGETTTLEPGQDNELTCSYGEYLEFNGLNQHGLYPNDDYFNISCPSTGAYEASGKLESLAEEDLKEGRSFYAMFNGNSGLRKADRLTIPTGYDGVEKAFVNLFNGCTNLVDAPDSIPYNNGEDCYRWMFNGCTNLTSVGVQWTEWPSSIGVEPKLCTIGWLANAGTAATNPTFKCPSTLSILDRDNDFVPSNWSVVH